MYDRGSSGFNGPGPENYQVNIGLFINEGWQIITQNIGGFIGFFVLSTVISVALSNIPGGALVNGFIASILVAGNYIVGFKILQGQTVQFGDFFSGFQGDRFLPILLASFISGLISGIFSITGTVLMMIGFLPSLQSWLEWIQTVGENPDPDIEEFLELLSRLPEISPGLAAVLIGIGLLLFIPAIYFGVAYTFAVPLVVEKRAEFWAAMETSRKVVTRQWFAIFALLFVVGLINFLGVCLCGFGLLITVPLSYGVVVAAYNNIFGLGNA